jgi:alkylhydroperoxidase family enzyme
MAYIRQIQEGEAQGLLKQIYDQGAARAGKVANIIKVMGLDPTTVAASMQLYLALMKSPNALGAARRELLAAVVSNVNDCYY